MSSKKSIVIFLLLILALLGIADAGYLTFEHFSNGGGDIVCTIPSNQFLAQFSDCGEVLESKYSVLFGIPLVLIGLGYYIFLLITALGMTNWNRWAILSAPIVSGIGVIMSAWFVYLQGWVLDAWCLYCVTSAIITTLFFILSLTLAREQWGTTQLQPANGEVV